MKLGTSKSIFQRGFAALGIVMVMATITLVGFVAFRFLQAQDNTEVASTSAPQAAQVAKVESVDDVDKVTEVLDTTELDNLDADLNQQFNF